MKKRKVLVFLVLLNYNLLISQNEKSIESNWENLITEKYSISYPSDWFLNQKGDMGTSFFIFTKLESKKDKFTENVNLLIQDLSLKELDLDKYTALSEKQIETLITKSKILESKRIKTDKLEFHKIIYSGDQGLLKLKFVQYYFVSKEKAYVLSFTCESKEFSKYIDKAEKIMNSFKIID
jgi:hypothetical protein